MHDANPDGAKLITDLKDCAEGGEIGVNDSVIFNAAMLRNDEEKIAAVFVGDPVELNGKINYTVRAFDSDGDFEIQRRFTEFEALRKALSIRLSGLYVHKLPKSSFFGDSKDLKFLQERSFHLEQFMKKLLRLPYLLQSGEFKVFVRPDQDLREKDGRVVETAKQIEQLPEQSVEVLAYRIKSITRFEQQATSMTAQDMETMQSVIANTQIFLRTHERFLQEMSQMIRGFMQQKDKYVLSDRYVAEFMEKYERLNLKGYNSGGYAYRESKKIFARAEEEAKAQRSNLKDISSLAESVRVKSSVPTNNVAQPSLFDKMKKAIGL